MADDVRHRHASAGLAGVGYGVKAALAVAIGGLLARYKLGGLVLHHAASWRFPLSTFVVNLIGCTLAGICQVSPSIGTG